MILLDLARRFRDAIEEASSKGELIMAPFNRFPIECCDLTCDLLAQYLKENDINTYKIRGTFLNDHQRYHEWLCLYNSEEIIDITGDQFNRNKFIDEVIKPVHVGKEGKLHGMFCNDRIKDKITIFTDPDLSDSLNREPNLRQKILIEVNNIVRKYISLINS